MLIGTVSPCVVLVRLSDQLSSCLWRRRLAFQGLGTPAPIAPPSIWSSLVISGLYRHVRNPMYVAVLLMIFGQGLLFGSVYLLEYGVIVWLGFFAFVILYEEPHYVGSSGQSTRNTVPEYGGGFLV